MQYNPMIHHRRSIRLKGYDYSQAGLYYVTICVKNKDCLFGEIKGKEMILNDAGQMVKKWCGELSNKFSDIMLDTYIIMPNHFHVIIINNGGIGNPVGADLRVCPVNKHGEYNNIYGEYYHKHGEHDNKHGEYYHKHGEHDIEWDEYYHKQGEHAGSPLRVVVQWFKTMTTNEYIRGVKTLGWQPFDKKLWQRGYYEHIIRSERSYQRIFDYIKNNPANWGKDKFYPHIRKKLFAP